MSRIRLWKAVAKGMTGSRCQPARAPVGGERRLLNRLVLRISKVRAYGEDPFRAIFGLELDCGKLWRRE